MIEFDTHVHKDARVRLSEVKARDQVNGMLLAVRKEFPSWNVELFYDHDPTKTEVGYRYSAKILFTRNEGDDNLVRNARVSAIASLSRLAPMHQYWECSELLAEGEGVSLADWRLPELTKEVLETYFGHIYQREAHIRIVYDSLKLATRTGGKGRHHVLLRGKPACAKTILFLAFRDWLGPEYFLQLSATTMTKAGLEKEVLLRAQRGQLPPVILLEEVEKTSPENLNALLQIMDTRGEIQKTNFNIGNQVAEAKILVWGTCNDEVLLRRFADGAIWSRFSIKPICTRPSFDLMKRILYDECRTIEGDSEWVDAIIKFLYEEVGDKIEDHDDPRLAKSLLVGGERLLDGSFFADFKVINGLV